MIQAAREEYGLGAALLRPHVNVRRFEDSISIKVQDRREERPSIVGRTVVDVSTKEYKNYAVENREDPTAKDITKAIVSKSSETQNGRDYKFTSAQGITWGLNADVGLRVLAMGMTGCSVGLDGKKKSASRDCLNTMGFEYHQEESVCIPPGKKVRVTITTYKVVYRLHYTFEFSLPKFYSFPISYRASCCCGICCFRCSKNIPYSRAVRHLPNYREDDESAYFTQEGFLTWIGESSETNKEEASVYAT